MKIQKIRALDPETLEKMGLFWHREGAGGTYIANDLIEITEAQAEEFYAATNELYDMFIAAAEHVIRNSLYFELNIPNVLTSMIAQSFEEDIHWHIYGRFDLAGGMGRPIKLLEFNADTPTLLYETAVLQWALLKHNGMDEAAQFNRVSEAISENFKRLISPTDPKRFAEFYENWAMLFACARGSVEDEIHTKFLRELAENAGFVTDFAFFDDVIFDEKQGVFCDEKKYEFLFKLIPWENIAIDEPALVLLMREMMANKNTIFLNPPYTLLFQSKRILKILWDLFPNHPLLLPASYEPLSARQVKKPCFGREGANVEILDENGRVLAANPGEYGAHKAVYQEFYALNSHDGFFYQPNVFFAYEACGLGFRRSKKSPDDLVILDNFSQFVAHKIS